MRILLDTNIYLGLMLSPERLDPKATDHIRTAQCVCFSVLSLWEAMLLNRKGKIRLDVSIAELDAFSLEAGLERLELTPEIMSCCERLPEVKGHKDPFDRMLIASAMFHDLTVLTSDRAFEEYEAALEVVGPLTG